MNCTNNVPKFLIARKRADNKGNINNVTANLMRGTSTNHMLVIEFE